jgi:UDP-glucose 4-epimerase
MTRLLVTGASGFIGRAVVAAFAAEGRAVRAAARRPPSSFPASVEVVRHGDLAHLVDWRAMLDGVDQVVHLAGVAHTGRAGVALYDAVNREATAQLAAAAATAGIRHFVFVSSIRAQIGPAADHALTEQDPPLPTDAYGHSKLAAEQAVRGSGVPFTILRPVVLYGPEAKGNFALLARAAASRWPLPLKDFNNRRSFLDIDNFISALAFVLETPATIGETYVVADPGVPPRLAEIIATLRQARGRRPRLLSLPPAYIEMPLRAMRCGQLWDRIGGNLRVDPAKLLAAGWRPRHNTLTGLAAIVQAATPRKSGTASRSAR